MSFLENTLWQFLDQGIGRVLLFVFHLCIPLAIGVEDYGRFALIYAAMLIVVQPAIVLGLDLVVVKRVARGDPVALRQAFHVRALLFLATGVLATTVGAVAAPADLGTIWLLWLFFGVLGFEGLIFAHFRGVEWMQMEGVIGVVQKCLALPILGLLALSGIRSTLLPAASLALSACTGALLMAGFYRRTIAPLIERAPHPIDGGAGLAALLREGAVVGLAAFVSVIYFRVDSIMLGVLLGNTAVGIYNIAYQIMAGMLIIPAVLMSVVFPRLVKATAFRAALGRGALLLAALGIAVSATVYFGGEHLIALLYGDAYRRAGDVLTVLALGIGPIYVGYLLTQALVATDRPRDYLRIAAISVALNVGLNLVLIPRFGEVGAAAATVATEVGVVIMAARLLLRSS